MNRLKKAEEDLTFEDIRIHYFTGQAILVSGEGRNKAYRYRNGVATYVLDKWAITNNGTPVDKSEITLSEDGSSAELTLAEGGDYVFNAVLRAKKFASVTAAVNDSTMGSATVTVDGNQQAVYEGQNVTLTAIPGDSYMLERWEVREEDSDDLIATTPVEGNANQVTFTMPATDKNITAKAFFAFDPAKASTECGLDSVELDVPGASVERRGGNFTIKVPANTSADTLAAAALKFITVSEDADVIRAGYETPWPTDGQACGMTLDTPVTFTVRSQKYLLGGDDNAKADYTVTVVRTKSTECAIEIAKLGNVVGVLDQTKKTVTFTVPADTEDSAVADMLLTINCSQYASIKLKGAETDWVNDTACGMKLNEEKTFAGVTYTVGGPIIGTDASEYHGLYGVITEIRDGDDKETENETPDIYCEFEPPVLPCEEKELEAVFSDLYEEPKTVEDIIFDYVIMAPEMIRPLDDLHTMRGRVTIYLLTEDWAVNGEQESNCEAFTDYDDARRILTDRLCQELDEGGVPQWKVSESFKEYSTQDWYEAYLEGEYMENHYKIMIVRQSLCVSPRFLRETKAVQQSAVKEGAQ